MPFSKYASAILDYQVNWATWLGADTIASSTWSVPSGITLASSANTTTTATAWLSGGTAGQTYQVRNTITTAGGRTEAREIEIRIKPHTILTEAEAAHTIRCDEDDAYMLDLLPAIDKYIETATGRNWAEDSVIDPRAKSAARMLLVLWHENPGMIGSMSSMNFGLTAALVQLEARALQLATDGIPAEELAIAASLPADGQDEIAITAVIVLVFNHEMAAAATSAVVLKTLAGATVTTSNALDATGKIMTVTPSASLTAATAYQIIITDAADVYGQTLTDTLRFGTA